MGPLIRADRGRIQQVLTNILSNAIKFTETGGRVHLAIRETGDGVRLEVQDTGIGMTPEQSEKALELFGQIESSIAHKFKGTGLGLPVAKRFVELHGGKLVVKSQVDVGTLVTVTFPPERVVQNPRPAAMIHLPQLGVG
jgi:signal transduction histidine kinase